MNMNKGLTLILNSSCTWVTSSAVTFVLCLNSIQERASKTLSSTFNKINFKNKQATKIFYLKSKLIQVYVKALPDWQLLHQVLENAILHCAKCKNAII